MSESTGALIPFEPQTVLRPATPKELIAEASEQANALADVIDRCKLYSVIGGKKYVRVEGWTTLARFNNVIPRELSNEAKDDGRYVATVALVRMSDGNTLSVASAECGGPDEQMWQNRPPFARRSMAATRATGKAARLAYAWILALAGKYETTPAEEMDHVQGKTIDVEGKPIESDPFDATPVQVAQPAKAKFAVPIVEERGVSVVKIDTRTSRGGKQYHRITFRDTNGAEKKITSFSDTVKADAERAYDAGITATFHIEVREKGNVLVGIDLDEPPF